MSGDEDDERFERYRMLQRYIGWEPEDAAALRLIGPRMESCFSDVIDDFYDRIRSTPMAFEVIREGEPQIRRLMGTLRNWLAELFSGTYDRAYVVRRWRIGRRHVDIGLDPSLVAAAMSRLRSRLLDQARAVVEETEREERALANAPSTSLAFAVGSPVRHRALGALDRLLDLEMAIVEEAYREEFTRRDQQVQRLATLGQVAGGIAHELRNPLNVIKTSVYFLTNATRLSPEKTAEHLGRIERQVDLANDVISAVAQFARLTAPERRTVDLAVALPDWVDNHCLSPQIVRDLRIEAVPTLQADARQLQIAVGNIVRNACEAMPGGGTLTITLRATDRHVEISIADQGHGMPPETLRRITEPWYSTRARGTGLGLAITKAVLEKHGAELSVTSEPGQGSRFTIHFPLES